MEKSLDNIHVTFTLHRSAVQCQLHDLRNRPCLTFYLNDKNKT